MPDTLGSDVQVEHVLVNPRPEAIRIQLIEHSAAGLVVVASATLDRSLAVQFIRAVAAGLADENPGSDTLIVG
jgi:hypothetical protein